MMDGTHDVDVRRRWAAEHGHQPGGLRTYAYDAASQRNYLIEPEGSRFTYSFDAAGRTNYV